MGLTTRAGITMTTHFHRMIAWRARRTESEATRRMKGLQAAFLMLIASGVVRSAEEDPPRLPITN